MGDIIRDWLRTRLGVIIDLSPEIFGRYASDGTLLGKVLHSYDVINDSQLNTLLVTQDPALSRVNLKHLRLWLRFIGVDCDADCIEDISNGKGTASLRLFYKVFLCLENKDRLHFITLQKEREKYVPSSTKFDVTTVPEDPEVIVKPEDHRYAENLKKSLSLVDWQRKEYDRLIDDCKKSREKFCPTQEAKSAIEETLSEWTESKEKQKRKKTESPTRKKIIALLEENENRREVDDFAKKHRVKVSPEKIDPCDDPTRQTSPKRTKSPRVDHEAARAFTKSLKKKHRQEAFTKSFKTRLQKNLLTELWQSVLKDQEFEFDEIVAKKVLHQSQYEKQLVRKLCDVRNQKTRMAENREIVEILVEERREREMRLDEDRSREVRVRESEEVEAENQRIKELERRIEEQTKQRRKYKIRRLTENIVNDIIDITARAVDYKMTSKESQVPKSLWNEWKALFFKGQPIIESIEDQRKDIGYDHEDEASGKDFEDDPTRTEILNDQDFDDYHNVRSSWQDFVPNVENRVYLDLGLKVLGHMVHKVLENVCPSDLIESPLDKMKTRAVVLDLPGTLLHEPIQELLRKRKIRVIRVEEAIDHCLASYKEEMKDFAYIDLEIIAATRETLNPSIVSTELDESGKKNRKKKSVSSRGKASSIEKVQGSKIGIDKVTQTPRVIPLDDMDPLLSDAAYIGKWTHEFLTLGEPISDELCARIILEYLKYLQPTIQGFLMVNYPNTYRQMSCLENTLSGRKLPENEMKNPETGEDRNIEEIDCIAPRIIYENEDQDSQTFLRKSRLVPNPEKLAENRDEKSYLTSFVRIKLKSDKTENLQGQINDDGDIWEILDEDATSIDAFYVDQNLATIIDCTTFDLTTLKALARLVISGGNSSISRASSFELFGDCSEYFDGRRDEISVSNKGPIVKKLLRSRPSSSSFGESQYSESQESQEEPKMNDEEIREILPGEEGWSWANFPQSSRIIESLADLWRNLENCYVENLKDAFHLKRINQSAIVPYKDHVGRHMREFIERPDKKQDLLHAFHRAFNEIDQDIRDDSTIKRELHCRIDDYQMQLWEICDTRMMEAEKERLRIINENWTSRETIILTNVYIDILQAEIDRCNDTLQFIQDYYTSMLKRPLRNVRCPIVLRKIIIDADSSSREEIASIGNNSTKSIRKKKSIEVKSSSLKIPQAPSAPDENVFKEEISKILEDVEDEISSKMTCHRVIDLNIRHIESVLDSVSSRIIDNLRKDELSEGKSEGSSRKTSQSDIINRTILKKQWKDFFQEWHWAIMFEINRIRLRLKIIEAAAMSDLNFLIDSLRRVFRDAKIITTERYNRELKSVEEMARTFRFAVEEEIPIQEEMLLDADRFIVRSNVLMFPDKLDLPETSAREEILPARFTMSQLVILKNILSRSAPSGIMPERSFVYILQDLIILGENDENSPLPSAWYDLRSCDVTKIVGELFDDEFVNWRKFIIDAIDIDYPSIDQLLDTFEAFKRIDDQSREIVNCEQYLKIKFWFIDDKNESLVTFDLPENFHVNEEETEEEEIHEKCKWSISVREKSDSNIEDDFFKPEEALRLAMAKKLLFEMFSTNFHSVNYIALLMAFCKDERPEIGLAKGLSLAIGGKICVDMEEGEKYVKLRYEDKDPTAKSNGNYLHEEATKVSQAILHNLLRNVFQNRQKKISDTVEENFQKDFAETIAIGDKPETKNRGVSINLPEEINSQKIASSVERVIVYSIHINVCQSVLAAFLPNHAIQPDILESGRNLSESIMDVYQDIREEEMDDEPGMILTHRFINHDFVTKLLSETKTFTAKNLGNIIEKIIRDKLH